MPATDTFNFPELLGWIEAASGCVVNFEDTTGVTIEVALLALPAKWHYHHGPYCEFAKLLGYQARCSAAKVRTLKKAERLRKPFETVCPQGVWDLVFPVVVDDRLVGAWYVGSLRSGGLKPLRGRHYTGPKIAAVTRERRRCVQEYGQMLVGMTRLILQQWIAGGNRLGRRKPGDFYREAVTTFIRNRYHRNIRLRDLAEQLYMHPNYLGQTIRKRCGASFRDLLTAFRIEKARVMLCTRDCTVTEAAYACGFNDSNYFSTVFRRRTGVTPRQFMAASRTGARRGRSDAQCVTASGAATASHS